MYFLNYYRSVCIIVCNIFSNVFYPIPKCGIMLLYIFFLLLRFRALLKRFQNKILKYDLNREFQCFIYYNSESFIKIKCNLIMQLSL